MKIDILAFGAHPDDVELGAGGTLCKAVALGQKVVIIDLTQGELGTRGVPSNGLWKLKKQQKSLEHLHVKTFPWPMAFLKTQENQLKVIRKIRQYQPEVVFVMPFEIDILTMDGKFFSKPGLFLSGLIKIKGLILR